MTCIPTPTRLFKGALPALVLSLTLLAGCAGPQVSDYAAEQPVLDLRQYFNGTVSPSTNRPAIVSICT